MKVSAISPLAILLSCRWGAAIAEASSIDPTGSAKEDNIHEEVELAESFSLRGKAYGSLAEVDGITERNLRDTCGGLKPKQWGSYQWPVCQNKGVVNVTVETFLDAKWMSYFDTALSDWNGAKSINVSASYQGYNNEKCVSTYGIIKVCNHNYGANVGWLGKASIGVNYRGHITRGVVRLNDYYFELTKYDTPEHHAQAMCHEIGHTFGLRHWDENFNTHCESCMDYSNSPYPKPNKEDLNKLDTIYSARCNGRRLPKYTYDRHHKPPGHDKSHSHSSSRADESDEDDIYWVTDTLWAQ